MTPWKQNKLKEIHDVINKNQEINLFCIGKNIYELMEEFKNLNMVKTLILMKIYLVNYIKITFYQHQQLMSEMFNRKSWLL